MTISLLLNLLPFYYSSEMPFLIRYKILSSNKTLACVVAGPKIDKVKTETKLVHHKKVLVKE